MEANKYSWNQTLKFSWGHIIAFVALIFISYVMYMGDFYQNGGNFTSAAIKVGIIDVLILATFIGAQILKGTDEKFDRSIIIERILIVLCPIVFVAAMYPYNHFWSVFDQRVQIERQFNASIEGAQQIFVSYDEYAKERIDTYKNNLNSILIARAKGEKKYYGDAGFTGTNDHLKKENFIHTLELQLCSQNSDSLKYVATKWINEANQGASVWNAFLVGNVEQISHAIKTWHKTLQGYSEYKLANEEIKGNKVLIFDEDGNTITNATNGINSLKKIYTQTTGIKVNAVWTGLILFFMLLFPYFLQNRNTRAEGLYFLIPGRKPKSYNKNSSDSRSRRKTTNKEDNSDDVFTTIENTNQSSQDDIFGGTF